MFSVSVLWINLFVFLVLVITNILFYLHTTIFDTLPRPVFPHIGQFLYITWKNSKSTKKQEFLVNYFLLFCRYNKNANIPDKKQKRLEQKNRKIRDFKAFFVRNLQKYALSCTFSTVQKEIFQVWNGLALFELFLNYGRQILHSI